MDEAEIRHPDLAPGPITLAELARAVDIVATPMMVTDLSARIEFVNEAAAHLFGRDAAALRGQSVDLILPSEFLPRVPLLIDLIRLNGRLDGSFPALRADGTDLLLDVSVVITTTVPDGAQWLVTTMHDLSDQVAANGAIALTLHTQHSFFVRSLGYLVCRFATDARNKLKLRNVEFWATHKVMV